MKFNDICTTYNRNGTRASFTLLKGCSSSSLVIYLVRSLYRVSAANGPMLNGNPIWGSSLDISLQFIQYSSAWFTGMRARNVSVTVSGGSSLYLSEGSVVNIWGSATNSSVVKLFSNFTVRDITDIENDDTSTVTDGW
jgi:hypothetical protein